MSGMPDIGIFSAQVGYSRLACGRLEGWSTLTLRDASQRARS